MAAKLGGPWSHDQVRAFLESTTIPLRLACSGPDGFPQVISVWFQYHNDTLQVVTHSESHLAKLLQRNNKVGFEVAPNEPPYHGVRGRGVASLQPLGKSRALDELVQKYLGKQDSRVGSWLLSRKEEELLVTIEPLRLFSWDYRERMADISE